MEGDLITLQGQRTRRTKPQPGLQKGVTSSQPPDGILPMCGTLVLTETTKKNLTLLKDAISRAGMYGTFGSGGSDRSWQDGYSYASGSRSWLTSYTLQYELQVCDVKMMFVDPALFTLQT